MTTQAVFSPAVRTRNLVCLLLCLGIALVSWQAFQAFQAAPIGPDAGYYLMLGKRILAGAVPYRDFRILHPAGAFYHQAAVLSLWGDNLSVVCGQMLVYQVLVLGLLVLCARRCLSASTIGLLCGALCYITLVPALEAFHLVLEPMSSVWGWLAIALASRSHQAGKNAGWNAYAVGICCGLAAAEKQIGILYALPCFSLLYLTSLSRSFKVVGIFVAGIFSPFALFFARYPSALEAFFQQNVVMLFSYAQGTYVPQPIDNSEVRRLFLDQWPFLVVLFAAAAIARLDCRKRESQLVLAFCLTGIAFLLPSLTRPYHHYYLFPLGFVCFALIYLAERLSSLPRLGKLLGIFLFLLVIWFAPLMERRALIMRLARMEGGRNRAVEQAALWIRQRSQGYPRVLILPDSPQLYFMSGTQSVTENYEFIPTKQDFDEAGSGRFPVFLVNRGNPRMSEFQQELTARGLRVLEDVGSLTRWGKDKAS